MFGKEATMGEDRSYDRGRAWRGGDEEEGGQSGLSGTEAGPGQPHYGRYPGGESNGGVDYPSVEGRDVASGRGAENPIDRGAGSESGAVQEADEAARRRGDDLVEQDVRERLERNPMVDATEITVRVEMGRATLEGEVESRTARHLAEDIVESTGGVLAVDNRLTIRDTEGRPDPDPVSTPTL
jgi:hypothetical protein